jgi:hypothetical protein
VGDEREDQARPDSIGADSLPRSLRDLTDLNNEVAGRDTGRAQRFHSGDAAALDSKREREKEKAFNELLRRLQDPEYARAYQATRSAADRAAAAVETALNANAVASAEVQSRLQEMRESAATLADGRKVFRGKDGRLIAEDGTDVSDQRASITGLSDVTPSWDDYARESERAEALAREREQIERYQHGVLNPIRQRLDDPDNPYDKDELDGARHQLEEQMPLSVESAYEKSAPAVSASVPAPRSAADEYLGSYELNAPDVAATFAAARDGATPAEAGPALLPDSAPKAIV